MFSKTLRRLTLLNSLVFLLLAVLFAALLYGYLYYRLFDKVDDAMRMQALNFQQAPMIQENQQGVQGRQGMGRRSTYDPRIVLVAVGVDGRMVVPNPLRQQEHMDDILEIAGEATKVKVKTVKQDDHTYRVMRVIGQPMAKRLPGEPNFVVKDIVVISMVDAEADLLQNLLWLMLMGLAIGVVIIVPVGHYLAKRAMVPIRESWGKQQQFVADASHELRTPIAGIYNNAELIMRNQDKTVAEESKRIGAIMSEAKRLSKLIAGLLTLARADAGRGELNLRRLDIGELVETSAEAFQALEEFNQVKVNINVDEDIFINADEERLRQLMVIILDNAVKFTPPGGRVDVECRRADKGAIISVADSGIGIAAEDLPYIFDRFFRSDKARTASGGTGLGLSIAKTIVEQHGGKLAVYSNQGEGTRVEVIL